MSALADIFVKRDIKAVIFDLDDTLFPEMQYVQSGFKAVSVQIEKDFGVDCFGLMLKLFGAAHKNVYNRALDSLGLQYGKEYIGQLVNVYREHTPLSLRFYPDVMPLVKELKSRGTALGIITDGRVEGQKKKLEALGCYGLFDSIIITDGLGGEEFRKPSVRAFEIMCSEMRVGFGQTAYIGDNPAKDFYIGAKGVFTVRVKRGDALRPGGAEYYRGVAADLTVGSLL